MTTQEILNSSLNKTQKGYKLYELGHTRAQVAEWITNGNYGYAQRAVISNNEDIRATTEEEFINDLIENGHIKILET